MGELQAGDADGADLADLRRTGPKSGRLQVDDDVGRTLQGDVHAGGRRQHHGVAAPGESCIGLDDVREQRARERDRRRAEREQPARRFFRDDRPATLFDELHQPVGRV